MPPPTPPSVNDGRMIEREAERLDELERLRRAIARRPLCGTSRPISRIASLNSSRSSATLIASIDAPISLTLYFSSMPALGEVDREVERRLAADGRQHARRAARAR